MAKVKVKDNSGLAKFNRFLTVVVVILLVATIGIVIFSSPKVAQDESSKAFEDVSVLDNEFKAGTYGGVNFSSQEDVVNYYVECYNNTKTMTVDGAYEGSPITMYKLLGDESIDVNNLLVEGQSNDTINKLVPGIVGGLFTGGVKSLSPGNSLEPKNDFQTISDGSKVDRTVSHLTNDDILACNVTDNGDGTITLQLQPKAQLLSMPGEDSQGRFFNSLGDISSVVNSISVLSFSQGTVDDNFVVNYAGGTGTIKINVANKEIVEADYVMKVHIDVKHANVAILKDKSASLDVVYKNHFPADTAYMAEKGVTVK
ncbi:hypothetical protein [uncultured Eubacterium sp.]|uniref:hypothetical protein n=1 Tax=uncultured Eubacterium sp. TaxID=165185 RepID=UPI0015B11BAE|nr:hypothetical protein [uncultured Eubacterium sp.]